MPRKHAGGRPPEGAETKLAPLNMRTTPELRARIEEAAAQSGRSLTQEVERRLLTTFLFDEVRGGPHIGAFVNMLASTIQMIENRTGTKWTEDTLAFEAVRAASARLLRWTRPRDPGDLLLSEANRRWHNATGARQEAADALDEFRRSLGMESRHGIAMDAPKPRQSGGLFASGVPQWRDAREGWTDEQRAEEGRLVEALQQAQQEAETASAEATDLFSPRLEIRREGEEMGESLAETLFQRIGPKPA
jgi:hypothetical protein